MILIYENKKNSQYAFIKNNLIYKHAIFIPLKVTAMSFYYYLYIKFHLEITADKIHHIFFK